MAPLDAEYGSSHRRPGAQGVRRGVIRALEERYSALLLRPSQYVQFPDCEVGTLGGGS